MEETVFMETGNDKEKKEYMNNLEVQELKRILFDTNPILFLGAGFSYGATNDKGIIPTGEALKDEIFKEFVEKKVTQSDADEIRVSSLQDMCQFIYDYLNKKEELKTFLMSRFKGVKPKDFHLLLTSYQWKRIYTVNIDDLVEKIYSNNTCPILVQNKSKEQLCDDCVEYIKLHGCVNAPEEPIVFSKSEYTESIKERNYKHDNNSGTHSNKLSVH